VIDNGLRLLRMDAAAAGRIGLTGFHPCAGHPFAAQLWLASISGVVGVEVLADHACDPRVPAHAERADLLVRHYPDPADAAFSALSDDERRLRRGDGFDASGAPGRHLTQDLFGTPLFGAGVLSVARDRAGTVVSLHGLSGTAAGFRVVAAVLDAFVTTLAFVHHTRPLAVVPYAEPARRRGMGDIGDPDTDDVQDGHRLGLQVVLPVNLTQPGDPPASDDDPGVMRFTMAAWAAAKPADSPGKSARLPASAMRARWWTARDWLAQPGAAPCACCAEGSEHPHDHAHDHHAHDHHHGHDHDHDHDHETHSSHASSEGTS